MNRAVPAAMIEGNLSPVTVPKEVKVMVGRAISMMGVLLAYQVASAELLTPIEQNRYVLAAASYYVYDELMESEGASIHAPGFGPFVATVAVEVGGGAASASGSAYQSSRILGDSIHAYADLSISASGFVGETWGAGQANSYTRFLFSISQPLSYSLDGGISLNPDDLSEPYSTGGDAFVELQDADGIELLHFGLHASTESEELNFGESGTLLPGSYALIAAGQVQANEHYAYAGTLGSFWMTFTVVPEPATLVTLVFAGLTCFRSRRLARSGACREGRKRSCPHTRPCAGDSRLLLHGRQKAGQRMSCS
jgi:hypothetical protein